MPRSILEAIREGVWDFEPQGEREEVHSGEGPATSALPGSAEKLEVLAARVRQGLPLWHPSDRRAYDDAADDS